MQSYDLYFWMTIALFAVSIPALFCNMRRDLMMLQQNSYMNDRYIRWFNQSSESTNYIRIGALHSAIPVSCKAYPVLVG